MAGGAERALGAGRRRADPDEYRRIEAIRLILLVEPDVVAAKLWRRDAAGGWTVEKYDDLEARIPMPEIGAELALGEVYDTLEPVRRLRVVGEG